MKNRFLKTCRAFIFFSLSILIMSCAIRPTPDHLASADYGPYPTNYEEIIKDSFSKKLFDPYSAVYTFGQPQRAWNGLGGTKFGWAVCGTINAKNRFGGYVGVQQFYALIFYDKIEREYTETMAEGFCKKLR